MVCRRKHPKSSRAGGKRPKLAIGALDAISPLVSLPTEIQSMIMSYLVQPRDLNHLCCTCKILRAVVLPTLYHTIELKVPLRWSRLPSLENLLASSSDGLNYTRCLRIVTKQRPQYEKNYCKLDKVPEADDEGFAENDQGSSGEWEAELDDAEREEEDDGLFRTHRPYDSASSTLNAFIRVLISKLPPQQLHTFWWEHASFLSTLTFTTLLKQQGGSIHTLSFREYTRSWGKENLANLRIGSLTNLGMTELDPVDSLATELLARNHQTLCHLRLGSEVSLDKEYADRGHMYPNNSERYKLTDSLAAIMLAKVAALKEHSTPVLRLESLSLIGFDLHPFAAGLIVPEIDFSSLSVLRLESCCGLEAAFPLLLGAKDGRRKAKNALRLHTLAIRYEKANQRFYGVLEDFLFLLKPLTHLHVLLEGVSNSHIDMRKVLRIHGKCLRSFVWDGRIITARQSTPEHINMFSHDHEILELVARHCPELKALGISLNWADMTGRGQYNKKIASSISQLSQLQTLNIRNPPTVLTSKETWLPNGYMMEGLATTFLNIITKSARTALALKTLAFGASTYGNVRKGMSHYTPNDTSTFFQLRIYHVNYDCRYRDSLSPKLHLIAKGTPADAWGNAEHLDIFTLYWLDGILPDRGV